MERLLERPAVSYQLLYHLPVHKRLPTEEIHLQIHPAAGIFHKEVKCLLSHFQTHQSPPAVVFSLPRKTVFTGQIAVVGDMQAERFHNRLPVFKSVYVILVDVLRKKLPLLFQIQDFPDRLLRLGRLHGKLLCHGTGNFFPFLHPLPKKPLHDRDGIVGGFIHHMDAAAVDIHHNMISVVYVLMYHDFFSRLIMFCSSHAHTHCTLSSGRPSSACQIHANMICHADSVWLNCGHTNRPVMRRMPSLLLFPSKFKRCVRLSRLLAALVSHGTGSLASGLAGSLAFAAAAFFHGLL